MASHGTAWLLASTLFAMSMPATASAAPTCRPPVARPFVTGLEGGSGSAVGPDGALYVTERAAGRVSRINPKTGTVTTFATGLPKMLPEVGGGGAMDVAFIGKTAYVLVTLVGADLGGADVVGIYRIDGPDTSTVIADIGAFSISHPPATPFFVTSGVPYAMEPYPHGFLVTDGHHNRVLHVMKDGGEVTELLAFPNIVPTGLAKHGNRVYMAQAGPIPHLPEDGKVVSFGRSLTPKDVASGARLLVDVEFGPGRVLYGLSQGIWPLGNAEGSPASPNTGALMQANRNGTFSVVTGGLNQPTSLEFIRNTAFVVTLGGEVWKIGGIGCRPSRAAQ